MRTGLAWLAVQDRRRGADLLFHNGGTGGFRAMLCLRPRAGDAVVMLTNHARGVDMAALRVLARLRDR
jgi:hypothetical protein